MFQSPSLRGSGRFACAPPLRSGRGRKFQSPSLRGSGRFASASRTVDSRHARFNPLHCGAVVASGTHDRTDHLTDHVSIPFIAGQWSLRRPAILVIADVSGCFNPLHCGAVVASQALVERLRNVLQVSIPFIAGQWSLPKKKTDKEK